MFGAVMFADQPVFYFLRRAEEYQNLPLRLACSALCVLLAFYDFWPQQLRRHTGLIWSFSLCFCLPFFFTLMSLKNHLAVSWMMNCMSALFFVLLLTDFARAFFIIFIGVASGVILFGLTSPHLVISTGVVSIKGMISSLVSAFVIGGIFARNNEIVQREKFNALHVLSANVAHEFRTPLAAIRAAMVGLTKYLPRLINNHRKAVATEVPELKLIREMQLQLLEKMPEAVDKLLLQANLSIDMMLVNAMQLRISTKDFVVVDMWDCLQQALARYPYKSEKYRKLVNLSDRHLYFSFLGSELLLTHLFFNLLKNAFYYIESARKGEIYVWVERRANTHLLFFKDTAQGIQPESLRLIFNQFYTEREGGTGIGLSYCKTVMNAMGGDMVCESEYGKYTTFILSFPKVDPERLRRPLVDPSSL